MLRRFWVLAWAVWVAAAAMGQEPVRVSSGVMAGLILTKVDPVYPPIAQAAGVSGAVVLHAIIGADGLVKNLQVISGPEMLRGAALDAVRRWTYKPYLLNGEPTPVDTAVTLLFHGGGGGGTLSVDRESGGGGTAGDPTTQGSSHVAGQGSTERRPARISGGVMAGQILTKGNPVPIAQAAGVSGTVVLHAIIGADGLVKNLQVISGPEMLRQAALDTVRRWTYKPYLLNGEPTPVDTTVTVRFDGGGGGAGGGTMGTPGQGAPQVTGQGTYPRGPTHISGGVMAGQILTRVQPVYPAEAKAKGVSGMVVMRATIGKDGTIENLTVISGPEELRESSVDAVSQWTYKPYLLNGEPTEVNTTITVNYNMGGPAAAAPARATPPADELGAGDGPPLPGEAEGVPGVPGSARISGGVMAGMIVKKVSPSYPYDARAKGITGSVVLHAIIGKDGAISNLSVVSGPEELRASAMKAVKQWRYRPYTLMGVPTEVDTTITVNYNMGFY